MDRFLQQAALGGVTVLAAVHGFPVQAQQASAPSGIADIVVTAQKRAQRLQDVPISVTALTGDVIAANRITTVRDLDAIAPNSTIKTGAGGNSSAFFSMRGLVSSGTTAGSDKGVALYLDGVYLGAAAGAVFDIPDLERVEVLKGPQGTLFGRNTTGGAISFVTRDPTGNAGFHQDLTFGNYDQFRSHTRIETPQFGPFSAVLNYVHSERRGETRNLGAGAVYDLSAVGGPSRIVSPTWLGSDNTEAVSLAVKADFADNLRLVYKFDYTDKRFTLPAEGIAALYPAGAGAASGLVAAYPEMGNATPIATERPDAVNNSFSLPSRDKVYGHNLTATYQATDHLTVKDILSRRWLHFTNPGTQLDGMGGALLGGIPFFYLATDAEGYDRQWSNETQINFHSHLIDVTAGYLYYNQHVTKGAYSTAPNTLQFTTLPGLVVPDANSLKTDARIISNAVYAQGELHLTSHLDLIGGTRYTWDRKDIIDNTILGVTTPFQYRNSRPTFLAGIDYKPSNRVLAYAKFGTGYISGGYLATLTYNPETARSWEAGLKADWLGRVRTNLALFYVNYDNQQFSATGRVVGVPQAAAVLLNAGDSRAYGFELENTIRPFSRLTLTANLGYTNFKYERLDPRVIATGNILPFFRPKWTGSFAAQYDTQPLFGDLSLSLRTDANFKSSFIASPGAPTPAVLKAVTVSPTWILNSRITLKGFRLAGGNAQLSLWGRNLTDNRHISNTSNLGFVFATDYERARTIGVDLAFDL